MAQVIQKLVIVITHDRDILQVVDKIIELTPNGSKVFLEIMTSISNKIQSQMLVI